MLNIPDELKYTKAHKWIRQEDHHLIIGITDYAQSELGDIVYLDLSNIGRFLQAEESFGTIESIKTASELYTPFGGEVIETNGALGAQPELINTDPYGQGWLIKLRPESYDPNVLLDAYEYQRFVGS